MAEGDDGGFLSRWSRRKAGVREAPVPAEVAKPQPAVPEGPSMSQGEGVSPSTGSAQTEKAAPPPPTLDDVAALTKDSDFSRFVTRDTDASVKNAAMKKLFASDPHFNRMDGLDVYIDDYNTFEPIPRNLLRQLVNARAMGLLDDELPEQPAPHNPADAHEDAALQLQPHDAPGQPGVERSAACGADRPGDDAPDPVPPASA
jgi:Protein of unknown function (DUF3306)